MIGENDFKSTEKSNEVVMRTDRHCEETGEKAVIHGESGHEQSQNHFVETFSSSGENKYNQNRATLPPDDARKIPTPLSEL